MTEQDSLRFFHALSAMALLFCDEMTKPRQHLYWEMLRDSLSIDEWEYACGQAMARETFHKVPLPAALMDYVREYRQAEKERAWRAQCTHSTQSPQALLQLRESLVDKAEVDALIASVWPEGQGTSAPKFPRPRLKLTAEELVYEPTVDAEAAKAKLHEQLRQLLDEQAAAREQARQEGELSPRERIRP